VYAYYRLLTQFDQAVANETNCYKHAILSAVCLLEAILLTFELAHFFPILVHWKRNYEMVSRFQNSSNAKIKSSKLTDVIVANPEETVYNYSIFFESFTIFVAVEKIFASMKWPSLQMEE